METYLACSILFNLDRQTVIYFSVSLKPVCDPILGSGITLLVTKT